MNKFATGRGIYYGWVMVATLSITETVSFGILYYAFTVFIRPMQQELGWSRAETTGAFSLALTVAGVAGLAVGSWLDRHGTRLLMTAGSVIATLLVFAWAGTSNLLIFYLIWVGIGVTMAAVFYEPAFLVVATWFRRQRGRALTLLTFIAGFASVIFLPLSDWLVQVQGWRGALVTLALILGIVTIPLHGLILRRKPEDLGLKPDGISQPEIVRISSSEAKIELETVELECSVSLKMALRSSAFWWLGLAFTLNSLGVVAITVHLVPYLGDQGYDSSFAATMVGLIGVMALPGRLVFNLLAERVPRSSMTAFIFLLQAISLVVLLLVQNTAGIFIFVALFGAGFGAITPLRAGMVADFYGPAYYGRIASVLGLFMTVARGLGPVGAGLAFDILHTYTPAFWTLAALSVSSAVAIVLAQRQHAANFNKILD